MEKVLADLRRKLPPAAVCNFSVRTVAREVYHVTIMVSIAARSGLIVATKESHNIFTAMHEARKAVLRQLFDMKQLPKRSA